VVALLHVGDTLTHTLDNAGTLVTGDNGEGTLGVLAAHHVGIRVADTGVVDLNADLVGFWRSDLDVLDAEVLGGIPGHGGLASDGLALGGRHDSWLFTLDCAVFAVDRDWMVSMGLLVECDGDEMRKKRECLSYLWNSGRPARLNYSADDVDVRSLAKWGYEGRAGKDSRWGGEAATVARPPLIHGRLARMPSGNFSQSGHASL
jgi:hypothetical protein